MKCHIPTVISAALTLQLMVGCTPVLDSLVASAGPEHAIVRVEGRSVFFSEVIWDAGLPNEVVVPGGYLGGYMFSVPPGATLGIHPVALRNSRGTSNTVDFNVTAATPFGAPRIDRVT